MLFYQFKPVHKRGGEYDYFKKHYAEYLLENILWKRFPHLKKKLKYMDVGTPLSTNYYLGKIEGGSYGLHNNFERFVNDFLLFVISFENSRIPDSGIQKCRQFWYPIRYPEEKIFFFDIRIRYLKSIWYPDSRYQYPLIPVFYKNDNFCKKELPR